MCTSTALVAVERFHVCFNGFAASKTDFFVFSWNGSRIRTHSAEKYYNRVETRRAVGVITYATRVKFPFDDKLPCDTTWWREVR